MTVFWDRQCCFDSQIWLVLIHNFFQSSSGFYCAASCTGIVRLEEPTGLNFVCACLTCTLFKSFVHYAGNISFR